MPLGKSEEIASLSLMLLFDIMLAVSMTGLVFLQGTGWPGTNYNVTEDFKIIQRQPLAHRGRDTRFSQSPIPQDSEMPEDFYLTTILEKYAER